MKQRIITLIGMSGTGKTYWAKRLAREAGFTHLCCDDMIEQKLAPILTSLGWKGINDVGRWLGQPYSARYAENASQYLQCERGVMLEIISMLETGINTPTVIDTTGSVIYTGADVLKCLKEHTMMVYLETPDAVKEKMLVQYKDDPKPVIWGNAFHKRANETHETALARCYGDLLAYRAKRYKSSADITLDYDKLRSPEFGAADFIKAIARI